GRAGVGVDEAGDVPPEPRPEQQVTLETVQRLRDVAAAALLRARAGFFAGSDFFDACATDARKASIRSITGASSSTGSGFVISWPASFASSSERRLPR